MSNVPTATVVQDGKLGGDVPRGGGEGKGGRTPYKRKLSNFLLDKKLQLSYVLLVTILSGAITGALGYLIYQQSETSTASIERDLDALTREHANYADLQRQLPDSLRSEDRDPLYRMIGVGVALALILSGYLVIMTHKVAGPLYKVTMYFDRMAEGRLGNVTPLRRGDMLQDFFGNFREMHDAVRTRQQGDVITMESAASALRTRAGSDAKLASALDALDKHVTQRKKQLL